MNVLYRYIASALKGNNLIGHSAEWESWCIADIFKAFGFTVDALNWKGDTGKIRGTYDVVFDIGRMAELSNAITEGTVKIFHMTGSDSHHCNQQEAERIKQVNARRGCHLTPQRTLSNPEDIYRSIEMADYVTLVGNQETLNTFPERYRGKMHLVDITASYVGEL